MSHLPRVAYYGHEDLLNLPRVANNGLEDFTLPWEVIYLKKGLKNPREVREFTLLLEVLRGTSRGLQIMGMRIC
jgi:hypothetical protein